MVTQTRNTGGLYVRISLAEREALHDLAASLGVDAAYLVRDAVAAVVALRQPLGPWMAGVAAGEASGEARRERDGSA